MKKRRSSTTEKPRLVLRYPLLIRIGAMTVCAVFGVAILRGQQQDDERSQHEHNITANCYRTRSRHNVVAVIHVLRMMRHQAARKIKSSLFSDGSRTNRGKLRGTETTPVYVSAERRRRRNSSPRHNA